MKVTTTLLLQVAVVLCQVVKFQFRLSENVGGMQILCICVYLSQFVCLIMCVGLDDLISAVRCSPNASAN